MPNCQTVRNVETKATPSYITADADKSLELKVEHLGMLADDAEARGAREEAAARHEDRIEAATEAAAALEGEKDRALRTVLTHTCICSA